MKVWYLSRVGMTSVEISEDVCIVHWDDNRIGWRVIRRKPGCWLSFTHKDYDTYLEALVNAL